MDLGRRMTSRAWLLGAMAVLSLLPLSSGPARASASTTYDFEACAQGWTNTVSGNVPNWQRLPLGEGSGYAFAYPVYEGDPAVPAIVSPNHTWSGGKMTLSFSVRWQFEHPASGVDTMSLSWTDDPNPKTKAWKRIQVFGGVTNAAFPGYNKFTASITPKPGIVRLRFQMNGDQLMPGTGAQVDNIVVPTAAPKSATC